MLISSHSLVIGHMILIINCNIDAYLILLICQVDIPNILKQRRQLAKLVLDYDSARAR